MNDRLRYLAVSIFVSAAWLSQPRAYAADCVWLGGIGNWTDSNWGTCLGGFPASGDTAAIGAGVVTLDQAVLIQQLSFSAGTITGNNDLGISGLTAITGGNSVMSGTGITRADGGLTIDGNFLDIQSTRNLVNGAGQSADWSAGGLRLLNPGSTLTNEATATFNITGTSRNLQGSGTFNNQGSLVASLADSAQEVGIQATVNNSGNIDAQTGVLRLGGGGSHSGSFTGSANGTLAFSGGAHTLDAASSVTATNVRFSSQDGGAGTTAIGGAYNAVNTVILANTASFNSTAQTGTLTQSGGALSGSGTLSASGLTAITGGNSVMSGTGITRADGGLTIDGNFLDIQSTRNLVNGAGQSADWSAGGLRLLNPGSTLTNEATATFNITGTSRNLQGSGTFNNQGSLVASLADSAQEVGIQATVNNSGNIDAQTGVLRLGGGGSHSGSFTGSANGTLAFSGGAHTLDAASSVTATNVRFSSQDGGAGTTAIGGAYNAVNTVILANTASFNSTAQTGTLTQSGGALSGSGTLSASGLTAITGGNSVMSGTGITRADGGLTIDGNFLDIQSTRNLVNGAGQSADWSAGGLRLLNPGSTLTNEATATFNITGTSRNLQGSGTFNNQGSLVASLADSAQEVGIQATVNNSGNIDAQTGVLRLGGGGSHSGSFTGSANGTLAFSGGAHTLDAASSVTATNVRFSSQDGGAGTTAIGGAYNAVNTVILANTASFNSTAQTGTLTQSGGALSGSGTLSASGLTAITGGNSVMSGTGITRADGGLTIDGNFLDIQSTRNLVNGAGQSADWSAGGLRLLNPGSTLTNEATATFNITGTSRNLQGSGTFNNQGSLVVALSGPAEAVTVTSGLVNDGNIAATNGSLILSTDASGTGNWQASGGRIQLNSAADVTTTGDVSVTGGGTLQLNNASSLTARDLTLDASATLEAIGNNTLALSGDLSFAMTGETQWVFDLNASLEMNGGSGALLGDWGNWSRLEIGGNDIGTDPVNHVGAPLGFSDNFDLSELVIGADAHVILRDLFDNGNRGGTFGAAEALYVDTLVFGDANAVLNLNGLHIYYNTLIGSTSQIINEAVPLPASVWLLVSGLLGLAGLGRRAGTA